MKRSTPLQRRTRLAARRATPRRSSRARNTAHMLWVKTLPCFALTLDGHVCNGVVEADHVGSRGLSQKSDDRLTIPLCTQAHRERGDFAGPFRSMDQAAMRRFIAAALADTARRYVRANPITAGEAGKDIAA